MRVFLTGATGFVGSGILSELLSNGHEVTCLVRNQSRLANTYVGSGQIRLIEGDLLQPDTYVPSLGECDAVIHLVGVIRERPGKGVTFDQVHNEGTKALVNACIAAGFAQDGKRFIHMSALGARAGASSAYFRSKWDAEEHVRQSGISHVIFRPSIVFGPGDKFVNMLADLVKMPLAPVVGDGAYRLQPVSLRTVCEMFVKALSAGPIDTVFDLGGPGQMSYDDMLREIGKAMGRSVRLAHVPLWIMRPMITLFERFPFFPITKSQLAMLLEENICREGTPCYNAYKSVPIPFDEGIREYIRP